MAEQPRFADTATMSQATLEVDRTAAGPARWPGRAAVAAGVFLLVSIVVLRVIWLDTIPALNGDEAWFGTMLSHAIRGEPYELRTPTGNWMTPLYAAVELPALIVGGPTILVLRLPVALWSLAGIGFWFVLWRRTFPNSPMSFWVMLLYAALPLHMVYARIGWDPGLLLATLPLAVLPAVRLAERSTRADIALFVVGCILSVWTAIISVPFIGMLAGILLFVRRDDVIEAIAGRLRVTRRVAFLLTTGLLAIVAAAVGVYGLHLVGKEPGEFITSLYFPATDMLRYPSRLGEHFGTVGGLLSGVRVYEVWAGVGPTLTARILSWLLLAALACLSWRLARSSCRRQRFIGFVSLGAPVLLIAFAGVYKLQSGGVERYVLWLGPLAVLVLVAGIESLPLGRNVKRSVLAALVCVFAVGFCTSFLAPLRRGPDLQRLFRANWPGERDPKEMAAAYIKARTPAGATVYAPDWWVHMPLLYLLPEAVVLRQFPRESERLPPGECYAVGFAGDSFVDSASAVFARCGRAELERCTVHDRRGRPLMVVARYATSDTQGRPVERP